MFNFVKEQLGLCNRRNQVLPDKHSFPSSPSGRPEVYHLLPHVILLEPLQRMGCLELLYECSASLLLPVNMAHRQALFKLQKPSSIGWLARVSRSATFDQDLLHGEVEQGAHTLLPFKDAQQHTLDISNISSAVWHPWSPHLQRGNVPR